MDLPYIISNLFIIPLHKLAHVSLVALFTQNQVGASATVHRMSHICFFSLSYFLISAHWFSFITAFRALLNVAVFFSASSKSLIHGMYNPSESSTLLPLATSYTYCLFFLSLALASVPCISMVPFCVLLFLFLRFWNASSCLWSLSLSSSFSCLPVSRACHNVCVSFHWLEYRQ